MTEEKMERTPCDVYTRVMGYIRPVSYYNLGKKSEFYTRKYYSKKKLEIDNWRFTEKYGNKEENK